MKYDQLIYFIAAIVFYSCAPKPSVTVLCERDSKGNYILKWETYPEVDNVPAEIYISDNDSVFPSSPTMVVHSSDYIAVIKSETDSVEKRKYFRIKIEGTMSDIVTNRFFELDSIQNFRDIGGYITSDNKRVRWGKIFRSGSLFRMTVHDSLELATLGIKTVVDMRSADVRRKHLDRFTQVNNIRLPIAYNGYSVVSKRVMDGQLLRGDAIIYTQDTYRDMVNNFASQYAELFDYLCDEKNYPIAYYCYLGKDQSGLATFFLLRALDVPMDVIEDDYLISDMLVDRAKLVRNADSLSESRQEAFTMLSKTDLAYLKYGIACIREKSGSIDEYMLRELGLTPEKRQKLKDILLH